MNHYAHITSFWDELCFVVDDGFLQATYYPGAAVSPSVDKFRDELDVELAHAAQEIKKTYPVNVRVDHHIDMDDTHHVPAFLLSKCRSPFAL